MIQDKYEKYRFLYEYGNPIIKNEAALYLDEQKEELRINMVKSPEVQYWIECLHYFISKPQVHNAADTCFENAMHKLISYGIKEYDERRIRDVNLFILDYINTSYNNFFDTVNVTILASWLAYMGYKENIVIDILKRRVDAVYSFVKNKDYNIYTDTKGFPVIPKARAMHPLVKPELYEYNVWKLPTIHDFFAFALLTKLINDEPIQQKIDVILDYIFDERYQRLYSGYGLMLDMKRRYYSMGWSMHLYRYFDNSSTDDNALVWQMALMSNFKRARETTWFKTNLEYLEGFEKDGLYEFPASYLREEKNKYYVLGYHMGLGEAKKNKMRLKLESTAWMLRIYHSSRCCYNFARSCLL